jgi:hypothetical protein
VRFRADHRGPLLVVEEVQPRAMGIAVRLGEALEDGVRRSRLGAHPAADLEHGGTLSGGILIGPGQPR